MILHALADYYYRKSTDPENPLAPDGFEQREIPFVIVIDANGNFVSLENTRTGDGKKRTAKSFLLPQSVKRASGVAANLLWDSAEYVLGIDTKGKPDRVKQQHEAFRDRILNELEKISDDEGVAALNLFLSKVNHEEMNHTDDWKEIIEKNPFMSFRLVGDIGLICQRPAVIQVLQSSPSADSEKTATCLISGETDSIERLHSSIKGVWGAQTAGANIVSFNLSAFNSWGKEQGANAPVGKKSVFAYTTALNHLLRKESSQRMQVGDASTVFWSEKHTSMESAFSLFFQDSPKDDPDAGTNAVRNLYASIQNGAYVNDDAATKFFVLGLAPNAARISIRFWYVDSIKNIAGKIKLYFDELDVIGREKFGYPSLFRLLVNLSVQEKADNIPPNLAGDTMRSILEDRSYPAMLLQSAVRRTRACQNEKDLYSSYYRAAIIKATINRSIRKHQLKEKELTVALDITNTNHGYRLGRLFAVLEKIQEDANPGLNATIRDRFYGAASSSPVTVFPNLMKLKNHHLSKLDIPSRKSFYERLIGEIMSELKEFQAHLRLQEQGFFAIGYYHQRQDFYKSKTENVEGK